MRWLVTDRNLDNNDGFGTELGAVTYWTADPTKLGIDLTKRSGWTQVTVKEFQDALVAVASKFPSVLNTSTADQKHLCLFVHGYNNNFVESTQRYEAIAATLFDGDAGLGELISFDWPSKGSLLGYLPDRATARKVADDLTNVLEILYDWMAGKQIAATLNLEDACRARTSVITHSMGTFTSSVAAAVALTDANSVITARFQSANAILQANGRRYLAAATVKAVALTLPASDLHDFAEFFQASQVFAEQIASHLPQYWQAEAGWNADTGIEEAVATDAASKDANSLLPANPKMSLSSVPAAESHKESYSEETNRLASEEASANQVETSANQMEEAAREAFSTALDASSDPIRQWAESYVDTLVSRISKSITFIPDTYVNELLSAPCTTRNLRR
jgi:hypothetical protein